MNVPKDLKYSKDHEWLEPSEKTCKVGVTEFAVDQLGDIVHLDLPNVGDHFEAGDSFGTIESTKTVSDLYLPISGKIVSINNAVVDNPESLQEDCYEGWLVEISFEDDAEIEALMTSEMYEEFILNEGQ